MDKSILQVPISKDLRLSAEQVALSEGFSSLQEYVRVLLKKISSREIGIYIGKVSPLVQLSDKASKRYASVEKDYLDGNSISSALSVNDLMDKLNETDKIS